MKSDSTNWILTLVLSVFAVAGAVLVLRTVMQTREWRTISAQAAGQNSFITQSQVLLNDVAAYNQKKSQPRADEDAAGPSSQTCGALINFFPVMNESPMPAAISETGVAQQISALQHQVFTLMLILAVVSGTLVAYLFYQFTLMLILAVVSGTLVAYLFYQSRQLSKSIEATQQQAVQIGKLYNQDFPIIQSVVKQLAAYGQDGTPDFQQTVLKKYGITVQTADAMKK